MNKQAHTWEAASNKRLHLSALSTPSLGATALNQSGVVTTSQRDINRQRETGGKAVREIEVRRWRKKNIMNENIHLTSFE
jgi:hypothetical protein